MKFDKPCECGHCAECCSDKDHSKTIVLGEHCPDQPGTSGGESLKSTLITPFPPPEPYGGPYTTPSEELPNMKPAQKDNWVHRAENMRCRTCMFFVEKGLGCCPVVGRCRRRAPTMQGWPVMFADDWCGDHKLDENKV